jgi:hypothetical protein
MVGEPGQVDGQLSRSQKKMGGGARYPYPKWVWTWFGGWWAEPANAKKNAVVSVVIYSGALAALWSYSASIEVIFETYKLDKTSLSQ